MRLQRNKQFSHNGKTILDHRKRLTLISFEKIFKILRVVSVLTSSFRAPLIFCVSSVALFSNPESESAKWRAAFNWSSVNTHSKSSRIRTNRQPRTVQSASRFLIVILHLEQNIWTFFK